MNEFEPYAVLQSGLPVLRRRWLGVYQYRVIDVDKGRWAGGELDLRSAAIPRAEGVLLARLERAL